MTIQTSTSKVIFQGNGATTVFTYSFPMPAASNAVVLFTDASGNQTTVSPGAYVLTGVGQPTAGGGAQGGTLTYAPNGSPIAAGTTLTLMRVIPYVQPDSFTNQGGLWPLVVEASDDNLEMQVQQLAEQMARVLLFNAADPGPFSTFPTAAKRALQLLGFDSLGNPIAAQPGSASVSVAMQPVVSAATTDLALADLGVSADMLPVIKDNYAAARGLFMKLEDGTTGAPSFPLVASATTGWYRHVSTADPISGSLNTWCLVVDGNERYRFFNSVLSCNLPAGDNFGITDGGRVFHIGNDGVGYYVTTTTDHMLRVGSHTALGPTIIFGDQSAGGTGFTGRFSANNFPFCFGNGGDLSIASNGVIIDTIDPPNTVIRITNSAGVTARTAMAFYRSGATLVGSIITSDVATSYVTTSDERLKTVIGPISNSGTLIDALAPFWHTWINTPEDKTHYVGLGAQSVAALLPGVVQVGVGAPGDADYKPWGADWTKMVPLLVAELKSLRARVAALEARP